MCQNSYYARNIVPAANLPTMGSSSIQTHFNKPSHEALDPLAGRPRPFITPRTTFQQHPGSGMPQNDGSTEVEENSMNRIEADSLIWNQYLKHKRVPQVDGDEDEDEFEADFIINAPLAKSDDENLGSELDDEDEEEEFEHTEDPRHENVVLCQYEKVTRAKNKWKCILKDGIVHVNGSDHIFHKANGDFEW